MSRTRLTLPRGDSGLFEFAWTDPATGDALPITGCTIRFTAKHRASDDDVDAVIQKETPTGVEIVDGPGGICRVHLDPEDTEALDTPVTLLWDLQLVDGSTPANVWTIPTSEPGELRVFGDITRTRP